jgi:hypothetical protein
LIDLEDSDLDEFYKIFMNFTKNEDYIEMDSVRKLLVEK